ncbi:MAG: hypothetical protein V3U76_19555 [Granulosicoccus sp.]
MPQYIISLLLVFVAILQGGEAAADTDILLPLPIQSVVPGETLDLRLQHKTTQQQLPVFGRLAAQSLIVDKHWQLYFQLGTVNGQVPIVTALQMPDGATLTSYVDTWYQIEWTPGSAQVGVFRLVLGAEFEHAAGVQNEQTIVLKVAPATVNETAPGYRSTTEALSTPDSMKVISSEHQSPEPILTNVAESLPVLQPIATHIISAGRTVSLRVTAELANGEPALLEIDRLPRNASLDRSEKGWYTFYWLTSRKDQGEHRFRLSVVHPDDASLRVSQDAVVIVGDPSFGSTVPSENTPSSTMAITYSGPTANNSEPGPAESNGPGVEPGQVSPESGPGAISVRPAIPASRPDSMGPGAMSRGSGPSSMSLDPMGPKSGLRLMSPQSIGPEAGPDQSYSGPTGPEAEQGPMPVNSEPAGAEAAVVGELYPNLPQ